MPRRTMATHFRLPLEPRASMRPGRNAPENRDPAFTGAHGLDGASMRPGRNAPENRLMQAGE